MGRRIKKCNFRNTLIELSKLKEENKIAVEALESIVEELEIKLEEYLKSEGIKIDFPDV